MPNKKPVNKTTDDPKPITLIVTIYPPKKGQRHVMVSGAPEGEMPLLFTGIFQERHALLDQAFAGVLKREPQIVTLKADKASTAKSITGDASDDETEEVDSKEAASDQLVTDAEVSEPESAESVPVSPITSADDLPAIYGDTGDLAESSRNFEAALEDIKAEQTDAEDNDNG